MPPSLERDNRSHSAGTGLQLAVRATQSDTLLPANGGNSGGVYLARSRSVRDSQVHSDSPTGSAHTVPDSLARDGSLLVLIKVRVQLLATSIPLMSTFVKATARATWATTRAPRCRCSGKMSLFLQIVENSLDTAAAVVRPLSVPRLPEPVQMTAMASTSTFQSGLARATTCTRLHAG